MGGLKAVAAVLAWMGALKAAVVQRGVGSVLETMAPAVLARMGAPKAAAVAREGGDPMADLDADGPLFSLPAGYGAMAAQT